MLRVTLMTGTYYAKKVDISDEEDREDIDIFTQEGTPCILVEDMEDLERLGIDPTSVTLVD